MKYISILLLLSGCQKSTSLNTSDIYDRHIKADKAIVISEIRCGCVDDFFVSAYKKDSSISLMGDKKNATWVDTYLPQVVLDSIYEKNQNAVLLFRKKSGLFYKILKTEKVYSFQKIIDSFFKEE